MDAWASAADIVAGVRAVRTSALAVTEAALELPLRPKNIGVFTQPISFIGLPVVAVPVPLYLLPIGVQIIAAPWREDVALRFASALEKDKIALAPRPPQGRSQWK